MGEQYCCPTFASLGELVASSCQVDGVLISTPHKTHFELGMEAIAAGMNVLIEKPMTTTGEDAQTVVDAAKAAGKIFMVNTTANWREQTKAAAKMVEDGKLGEIRHVQLHMGSPLMMLFDDPTRTTWVEGVGKAGLNGFAWGQLSHPTSWLFKVTGLKPAEAFCFMGISENSGADLSDAATVRCTNGATISISGTAMVPGVQGVGKQIDIKIYGDKGMLTFGGDDSDPSSGELLLTSLDGSTESTSEFLFEDTTEPTDPGYGTGPASVTSFIDGCLGRPFFEGADVDTSQSVVQLLEAMYLSAKSGKAEKVA